MATNKVHRIEVADFRPTKLTKWKVVGPGHRVRFIQLYFSDTGHTHTRTHPHTAVLYVHSFVEAQISGLTLCEGAVF